MIDYDILSAHAVPTCPRSGRRRSSSAHATSSRRAGGNVDGEDAWGRRKLAYEIKKGDGVYHLLSFSA